MTVIVTASAVVTRDGDDDNMSTRGVCQHLRSNPEPDSGNQLIFLVYFMERKWNRLHSPKFAGIVQMLIL